MWKDFKEFAFKGNMIDLAVAVVLGAAFNDVIKGLVDGIFMPLLGKLFGASGAFDKDGKPVLGFESWEVWGIKYGVFLATFIKFLIVAFALFLVVKAIQTAMKKKSEEAAAAPPPEPPAQEKLLAEIRDLLKKS